MLDDNQSAAAGANNSNAGLNPSWTADVAPTPIPESPKPMPAAGDFQVPVVHVPVIPAPNTQTSLPPVAQGLPQVPKPMTPPPLAASTPAPVVPTQKIPVAAPVPASSAQQPTASAPAAQPPRQKSARTGTPLGLKLFVASVMIILIGAAGFAWWEGYLFVPPHDASVALVRMGAAIKNVQSYHIEGNGKLNFVVPASYAAAGVSSQPATVVISSLIGDRVSTSGAHSTISLDLTGLGSLVPTSVPKTLSFQTVQSQGKLYANVPFIASLNSDQHTATWYALTGDTLPIFTKTADTVQNISAKQLKGIVGSAKYIGSETLGSTKTTHYQYVLDTTALMAVLPAANLESINSYVATQSLVVDLWLENQSLLPYKLTIGSTDQTAPNSITFAAQFSQYGTALSVPSITGGTSDANLSDLVPANLAALQVKGRDLQRKTDLASIKTALGFYQAATGLYPITGGKVFRTNDSSNPLKALVDHGDIQSLPVDPVDPTDWYGYSSVDGTSFELTSILEDTSDLDGVASGSIVLYSVSSTANVTGTSSAAGTSDTANTSRLPSA